jgi:hypothetical protein
VIVADQVAAAFAQLRWGGGHASSCWAERLVVAPEAQHLHDPLVIEHLVDETVLDVDAP